MNSFILYLFLIIQYFRNYCEIKIIFKCVCEEWHTTFSFAIKKICDWPAKIISWICSLFCGTSEFNELISEFFLPDIRIYCFYCVTPCYQWYMRLQSYHKISITKQQKFFRIISPLIDTLYYGNIHYLNWHLQTQSSIKSD